jgi:hypothetical protein
MSASEQRLATMSVLEQRLATMSASGTAVRNRPPTNHWLAKLSAMEQQLSVAGYVTGLGSGLATVPAFNKFMVKLGGQHEFVNPLHLSYKI